MNTQAERIKVGQEALRKVKAKVVSSNCIIPINELPFVLLGHEQEYIDTFGLETYQLYRSHLQQTNLIRETVGFVASKLVKHFLSVAALAVTEFGVGECHESATLALYYLFAENQKDLAMIGIESAPHAKTKKKYCHVFILIGFKPEMITNYELTELDNLPDEVVMVDPFLNCVVPANQFRSLHEDYLKIYEFKRINAADYYESMPKEDIEAQRFHTNRITNACLEMGLRPWAPTLIHPGAIPFDIDKLEACESTLMARAINAHSSLNFKFGHCDLHLHAFAEVKSPEDIEEAKRLQQTLKTGYMHQQSSKSFFVMHNINHQGKQTDTLWQFFSKK